MNVLMLPLRLSKGIALVWLVTACATDAPVPADTRVAFTAGFGGDPFGEGGSDTGGDSNLPVGGSSPGGIPSAGGAYAAGGAWGTGGYGFAGSATGGSGAGGYGLAGGSPGGFVGSTGGANSGGACLLPFLCAGGAGGTAGAAGMSGAGGSAGSGAVGGAGFCDNATCFDVFDCWLYFPDKTACKFTKCEGLLCKP
jgi:hypothetical protein